VVSHIRPGLLSYVGLHHSGMSSYVLGDGEIIHLARYQMQYIEAKAVKSFPVYCDQCLRVYRLMGPNEVCKSTFELCAVHHAGCPLAEYTRFIVFVFVEKCCNVRVHFDYNIDWQSTVYQCSSVSIQSLKGMLHRAGVWSCIDGHHSPNREKKVVHLSVLNARRVVVRSYAI
jgi:hypothetical protein